jgi:hypothetical protein
MVADPEIEARRDPQSRYCQLECLELPDNHDDQKLIIA